LLGSNYKPLLILILARSEVAKHTTINNCWVIIKENVYDVTEFLKKHPGGAKIILALQVVMPLRHLNPFIKRR
jgi:cytochrome b involved in lipid metabolism